MTQFLPQSRPIRRWTYLHVARLEKWSLNTGRKYTVLDGPFQLQCREWRLNYLNECAQYYRAGNIRL